MEQQITKGIKVSVTPRFQGTFQEYNGIRHGFGYTFVIENNSDATLQLLQRHWEIKDILNALEIVDGDGVIGLQPVLGPGDVHRYNSGALLIGGFGTMKGHYTMVNINTNEKIKVEIPEFKLNTPFVLN